jgi:hypothetical protein
MAYNKYNTTHIPPFFQYNNFEKQDIFDPIERKKQELIPVVRSGINEDMFKLPIERKKQELIPTFTSGINEDMFKLPKLASKRERQELIPTSTNGINEDMFKLKPKETLDTTKPLGIKTKEKPNISSETMDAISGVLDFGLTAYSSIHGVAASNEENTANTINMGVKGAQAGMLVGGPIGAGIGAVVGVGAGLIDSAHDKKERNKISQSNRNAEWNNFQRQEDTYLKLQSGQRVKAGEQALLEKQKRFII